MTRRFDISTQRPLTIAHRAGNDLALLGRAERLGVDLVEADVRFRRGRLEVHHYKTMGPVPLLWDRWSVAPGWTRRLQLNELLAALRPGTELLLDLKPGPPSFPLRLLETMRACLDGRDYSVCSQFWPLLEPFRRDTAVRVFHSIGGQRQLESFMARTSVLRPCAVSIHRKLLTQLVVDRLLAVVPVVVSWPVNRDDTLERLRGWGVNGFISDSLDVLAPIVSRPLDGSRG